MGTPRASTCAPGWQLHPGYGFYRARHEIGRPDFGFHDLRHFAATMAAISGVRCQEAVNARKKNLAKRMTAPATAVEPLQLA